MPTLTWLMHGKGCFLLDGERMCRIYAPSVNIIVTYFTTAERISFDNKMQYFMIYLNY